MGKVIELRRPPDPTPVPGLVAPLLDSNPVLLATERLVVAFGVLIASLEASHRRIRLLVDAVPEGDTKASLTRDLVTLETALEDAKSKAVSVGILQPGG